MRNLLFCTGTIAVLCWTGAGTVMYSNDFSSRTSERPVPRATWFEKTYAWPAALFYSYSAAASYSPEFPYDRFDRVQDGWAKTYGNNQPNQLVNFWARTDADADNPFACFSNQTGQYGNQHEVMAVQTLHNAFSNGVLRFSVDLRGPARNNANFSGGYFRVKALFGAETDPGSAAYAPYALAFGMDGGSASAPGALLAVGSDGNWESPTTYGSALVTVPDRTHWYRFVADMNLDASTYSCSVYDLGTDQPTPQTATPETTAGKVSGKKLYRRVAEYGPVCGIGIHTKNMSAYSAVSSSDSTLSYANCPSADNLRVWWKATEDDSDFGETHLVYDNDFAKRRFRCLQGTTASTETADRLAVPTSDAYTYWDVATTDKVSTAVTLVATSGTTGRDGWSLAEGTNKVNVTKTDEGGGNVLAMTTAYGYTKVVHAIGKNLTSGKVKFEGDLRLPDKWYSKSSRTFTLCLGTDALTENGSTAYAIRVGFGGETNGSNTGFYPYCYVDTAGGATRLDNSVSLAPSTWYRVCVTADLATKKYDFALYELGTKSGGFDRAVPTTPVYTRTANGFYPATAPSALTMLAVYAYSCGSDWKGAEIVDNIRISTGTDGEVWTPVYENTFAKRTRYGVRTTPEATLLSDEINRAGLDGWMRRGECAGEWLVRDNGNPCLTFESEASIGHAQHQLPRPVTRGTMTLRVDMRPPSRCTSMSAQTGRVYVGGDEYAQGEVGTNLTLRSFLDATVGNFGFTRSGTSNDLRYYTKMKLYAADAAGDHTTYEISGDKRNNWYRFLATFDLGAKTWKVDVYDQGTTQPSVDTANGTSVASFTDLTFKYTDPTGITTFGIAAGGSAGHRPTDADTRGLLVDNVVVERNPPGSSVLIR